MTGQEAVKLNDFNNPGGLHPSINEYPPSRLTSLPDFTGEIDGKSVIPFKDSFPPSAAADGMWPRGLSDFLRDYQGRSVLLEYALPNGAFMKKRGVMRAAGTNFLGIQPQGTDDLLLVDLSSVRSVSISGGAADKKKR